MKSRSIRRAGILTAMLVGAGVVSAPQATAAEAGSCGWNGLASYYNSGWSGACGELVGNMNYGVSGGTWWQYPNFGQPGSGQNIKNNSATAWNFSDSWYAVYFNSNQQSKRDIVPPHSGPSKAAGHLNFGSCVSGGSATDSARYCYTYNQNASQGYLA